MIYHTAKSVSKKSIPLQIIRSHFVNFTNEFKLNLDLTIDKNSNALNCWSNNKTQEVFLHYAAGLVSGYQSLAGYSFGLIKEHVYSFIEDNFEGEASAMAQEMMFYINDLYINRFGHGFMEITKENQERKKNPFTVVH